MANNKAQITVENLGPVIHFDYVPKKYGVHVLRGHQGAGKTTILRAVQLVVDKNTDVRPTPRDGSRRGEAIVAGRRIRITETVRHDGELAVQGVGDLSIADLHSPKFKEPETRDRHRIKILTRLAEVEANAALFHSLLRDPEQDDSGAVRFNAIVPADSLKTDDLVEMTARVKRSLESEAQKIEKRRDTELSDARSQATVAEGIDIETEHDEGKLQQALSAAIATHARLESERQSYLAKVGAATLAEQRLAALPVVSLEEVNKAVAEADQAFKKAHSELLDIESKQEELRRQLELLETQHQIAVKARIGATLQCETVAKTLQAVQSAAKTRAELESVVGAAASSQGPSTTELTAAAEAKTAAEASITEGVRIRNAIKAIEKRDEHMAKANRLNREAEEIRQAAKDTRNVLADAVAQLDGCPLGVTIDEDGHPRLCIETMRSDKEYFDELSDGERWPVILGIAAAHDRMIVLPQAAYGELSPETRRTLDKLAKKHECYILTAIADDCELTAEAFE